MDIKIIFFSICLLFFGVVVAEQQFYLKKLEQQQLKIICYNYKGYYSDRNNEVLCYADKNTYHIKDGSWQTDTERLY